MTYCHLDDISKIKISEEGTVVYDANDEVAFTTPLQMTEEQALSFVRRLNHVYDTGVKHGSREKAYEILRALELTD